MISSIQHISFIFDVFFALYYGPFLTWRYASATSSKLELFYQHETINIIISFSTIAGCI